MKHKKLLVTICILAALLVLSVLLVRDNQSDSSKQINIDRIKIKGFTRFEGISCAALMPECGYCPGEVKDESCYVSRSQFDEYKKLYSELEAN